MRDFLDDLERQLAAMAEEHPDLQPEPSPARQPIRRGRRRRPAALGGLAAVLAAVAAAFTMTGTSLAELPILGTPTQDASKLKQQAGEAAKAGVDFKAAHVFGTPGGPGYALVNKKTQTLCLVTPDPSIPGTYGVSCGQPISKIEREGLKAEMVGDLARDPNATALVAFVLPEGAKDAHLTSLPPRSTFKVDSGVAVINTTGETKLVWKVDGVPHSEIIEGPFPATETLGLLCSDGTRTNVPMPTAQPQPSPEEIQRQLKALRKQACK